jgi:hypothetical protein
MHGVSIKKNYYGLIDSVSGFDRFWFGLEIDIKMDLEKTWESMDWIGLLWLRIGTGGRLL